MRIKPAKGALLGFLILALCSAWAQKIKVIVDQDARGPATTDMQSMLIFLQSDKFDVLGITTVSGDQWVKEETQRTLRLLEIAGRTDIPVASGAATPLVRRLITEIREPEVPKYDRRGGKDAPPEGQGR